MKKRMLSLILTVCMVVMLMPTTALAADVDINSVYNGHILKYKFTGSPITLKIEWVDELTLTQDTDYTVSYRDKEGNELDKAPSDIGDYEFIITGIGDYSDSIRGDFGIYEFIDLSNADIYLAPEYSYTGLPVEISELTVTLDGKALIKDTDYEISYLNESYEEIEIPSEAGSYYLKITGIGDYTGEKEQLFSILESNNLMMTKSPMAPQAIATWTETITEKPAGYSESGSDITISSAEGLAWLASVVNGLNGQTANNLNGKTVTLIANIDLEGHNWTPVGTEYNPFSGTFNGAGHSISNMTVTNTNYAGLFGYSKGTIENLSVSGSVSTGGISGNNYGGGIVGYNYYGKVTNCYNTGTVTAQGSDNYTGGLVGNNLYGTIKNCYNTGTVTAQGSTNFAGGLMGNNLYGEIANCNNTGNVIAQGSTNNYVGGLVGDNNYKVDNCYNTGTVTAENGTNLNYTGGLVGCNEKSGTVVNCYNTGHVTVKNGTKNYAGGLAGNNNNRVANCYNTGHVTAESGTQLTCAGGLAGHNNNSTITNCYNKGTVKANGGNTSYAGGLAGHNNNRVANCYNTGTVTAENGTDLNYAGGLVGHNNNRVANCYNTGTVTAENGTDLNYAGGLVGCNENTGKVVNCYNRGDVTANGGNYKTCAGGLVGSNNETVDNCYNTGTVTAENGTDLNYAGGLVGCNENTGKVVNCYWLFASASAGIGNNYGTETNCDSFTAEQGKGTVSTFTYTIDPNPTKIGTLCDALNDWVKAQSNSGDYYEWINLSAPDSPVFYISYTLTFNANGGTVTPTSKTVIFDDSYGDLPTPDRNGYTFDGWFTETKGGTEVTSTDIVALTADQTLYAHWTANSYTVTFDANGGTVTPAFKTVIFDKSYGDLPTPDYPGYEFNGWYTNTEGGTKVTSDNILTLANNHTLYAHWRELVSPTIDGPREMTLTEGYDGTETDAYTIEGYPIPTITQDRTYGGKIVWNDATKKLDIAEGLKVGNYSVVLTASVEPEISFTSIPTDKSFFALRGGILNNNAEDTLTFTLTVLPKPVSPTIDGPREMTLTEGYDRTGTDAYTIGGYPIPTITQDRTYGGKIVWNDATKKLDIAEGLKAGSYSVVLTASVEPEISFTSIPTDKSFFALRGGILNNNAEDTLTFTLTVLPKPVSPTIDGPREMTLTEGYDRTGTDAYTIGGYPIPTITQDRTYEGKIVWNDATKKLDIAKGLKAGSYSVVLTASNGVEPDTLLTLTLTVEDKDELNVTPKTGDHWLGDWWLLANLSVMGIILTLVIGWFARRERKDARI